MFLSMCLCTQGWNSQNSVQLNPKPLKSNPKNVWSTKVAKTARWAISEHGWTTPRDDQRCLTALNLVLSWQNNKTLHPRPGDFENHMSLTVWSTALPHSLEDPSISWPITGRLNSGVIKMEPQWAENEVNWSLTGIKWGFTLTEPLWRGFWLWNNCR